MDSLEAKVLTLSLEIGMNKIKASTTGGFTLIEILVVLIIVGITLTFAVLSFGDFGQGRRMKMAGQSFVQHIQVAQQQAVLEGQTYGVKISGNGYQIFKFNQDNTWQPLSQNSIFRFQYFPRDTLVQFSTSRLANDSQMIILNASGDMSPFSIKFKNKNDKPVIQINGRHDGTLTYVPTK